MICFTVNYKSVKISISFLLHLYILYPSISNINHNFHQSVLYTMKEQSVCRVSIHKHKIHHPQHQTFPNKLFSAI